jgi:hypothetical protein
VLKGEEEEMLRKIRVVNLFKIKWRNEFFSSLLERI